ncbi:MAG: hypothetical protein U9R36_04020, partial [Elusimicrobiota bacterium]|nr:hypothetical protein [Elusimicrobiota bacterium]
KTETMLGEKIRVEIKFPYENREIKDIELQSDDVHIFKKDIAADSAELLIGVYNLGEIQIPIKLYYLENGKPKETELPGFKINVKETVKDREENGDIRPIKGPAAVFNPLWLIPAVLIIAVLIFIFFKNRQKKAEREEKELTPREVALNSLREIKEKGLPSRGKYKEYYDAVSDCLRWYIELKYNIRALGSTFRELKEYLRQKLGGKDYGKLIKLLEECDHIKFTPQGRRPDNIEKTWKEAYKLIDNEF